MTIRYNLFMSDYYAKMIFIPTVTKSGDITGQIERWEAHEKGILHKAFSVAVFSNDQIYLQIRKHPVFDRVVDVTASSHPMMINGKMEDEQDAVIKTLKREWNTPVKINEIKDLGSIYYKSKDKNSKYIEHEYCTFYVVQTDKNITPDLEFAYGYSLVELEFLKQHPETYNLAPWVVEGMKLF